MKILILNDDLRSVMQMYLALSNHYDVEIAQDIDDLLNLIDQANPDFTFFDLTPDKEIAKGADRVAVANQILKKHPKVRLVGICDRSDRTLQKKAVEVGIPKVITRPIKNRELMELIKE